MPGPRTIVFVGPSWPDADVSALDGAERRPPARKGDVYALLATEVERIVLLDGVFHGAPSVWHREILAAVDEGITVLGAASMGALRAAELDHLGVLGHGTIYGWYRDGVIDGDDEVALLHGPEENHYVALSEPLVNIRATLLQAVANGLIGERQAAALVEQARRTHYPDRSLARLLDGEAIHGWTVAEVEALRARLLSNRVDLKQHDARAAIERARTLSGRRRAARTGARPHRGAEAERILHRRFVMRTGDVIRGDAVLDALVAGGAEAELGPLLASRWFTLRWAEEAGIELRAGVDARAAAPPADDRAALLRRNAMTESEYLTWLADEARFEWLLAESHERFGIAWPTAGVARLEEALGEPVDPRVAASRPFVVAWACAQGFRCPDGERQALVEALTRRTMARHSDPEEGSRESVDALALARWMVRVGPEHFGYTYERALFALRALQATDRLQEVLRP